MGSGRPIDRMRDSGGGTQLPDGSGNVIELVVIDDQLLIVAEHGIYSVRLADQIDPERQNPAIPFAVRRQEIPYGADTEFVCQTVMTAKALANDAHLPDEAKGEAVLRIAMRAAFELAGAVDVANDLRVSEASMRARVARQELKPAISLAPTI